MAVNAIPRFRSASNGRVVGRRPAPSPHVTEPGHVTILCTSNSDGMKIKYDRPNPSAFHFCTAYLRSRSSNDYLRSAMLVLNLGMYPRSHLPSCDPGRNIPVRSWLFAWTCSCSCYASLVSGRRARHRCCRRAQSVAWRSESRAAQFRQQFFGCASRVGLLNMRWCLNN